MIFKSKNEMFFWLACLVVANVGLIIPVSSIGNVPATVWGIIIGMDALFSVVVITLQYFLNRKDLKKYTKVIKELRKIGIIYTALQLDKIFISGYWLDEEGQIARIDLNGCLMPLSPGHRIILDHKGYPKEFDEYGNTIKEPVQKYLRLVIFLTVIGTIVVIGGFVALWMFLPQVGVTLFILILLTLFFCIFYLKRRETPNSYIERQKKWIRPQLKKAHEAIMGIYGENIQCFVDNQRHFLHYFIMHEGEPYVFIAMQATILPYKGICLYPGKREALTVFADKLHNNKISGYEIYFPPNESIDYELIMDIASFCLGVE